MVGIPIILFLVWHGGLLLLSFIGLVMIMGILEMARLLHNIDLKPNIPVTILAVLSLLVIVYLNQLQWLGIVLTMLLVAHLLLMLKNFPHYTPGDGGAGLFIVLYVGLFIHLYLLSLLPQGHHWLYVLLLGTWASDTFAYFCGRSFGKNKLTPVLSPNKTWEGAVGGLLGSVITVYIYSIVFNGSINITALTAVILGILISISSQIGDLMESTLKRQAKIKDSGKLIPGHGGVLDRFDSMMLSAPTVYYFVLAFIM